MSKRYISLAALWSDTISYKDIQDSKATSFCTKQQKRRRSVARKNRKANRKNHH